MRYVFDPDMNNIIRGLVDEGWMAVRQKKHCKLFDPLGRMRLVASLSPSEPRALANFKSHVRKARREYEEGRQVRDN